VAMGLAGLTAVGLGWVGFRRRDISA
jgi:hypothetical protein